MTQLHERFGSAVSGETLFRAGTALDPLPRTIHRHRIAVRIPPETVDQRFVEYLLLLTNGVTGRITKLLKGAAIETLRAKRKAMNLDQLMVAGVRLPNIINPGGEHPFTDTFKRQ